MNTIISIITELIWLIVLIDLFIDTRKYYKIHKVFLDYIIKQYPYRIAALLLWLLKSVLIQFN